MEKKGNNPFNNLTREDFYKYYLRDVPPLSNFVNLIKEPHLTLSKPLNILIGANNLDENDYKRFTNSPFSLFIDIMNLKGEKKEKDYTIEVYNKQYDMYTLFSNSIFDNMMVIIKLFKKIGKFVDNYYVDMMTAYFLPKDDYMNIIINTLKPGGKFIFEHTEHTVNTCFFKNGVLVDLNDNELAKEDLIYYKIDNETHTTEIINTDIFDKSYILAPSFPIKILYHDGNDYKYYQDNLYEAYSNYLAKKYPMFNVELKTYTFCNFTYPVPININYHKLIKFTFEVIMTPEEQALYITERTMSKDKINEFAHRLLINDDLKKQLLDVYISKSKKSNVVTFREDLLKAFNKILYYYELTMRGNILNEGDDYKGANYQGSNYQIKYLKYKNKYLQLKNHKN
jgi:hypothetical protein